MENEIVREFEHISSPMDVFKQYADLPKQDTIVEKSENTKYLDLKDDIELCADYVDELRNILKGLSVTLNTNGSIIIQEQINNCDNILSLLDDIKQELKD